MRQAFPGWVKHGEVRKCSLLVRRRAGAHVGLAGSVDLRLLVVLALVGSVGVHLFASGGLISRDRLQRLRHASMVLAGVWVCLTLFRVRMGWGARQLYAGPLWDDEPAESLWSVCCYRVGIAAGWTVVVVAVMLVLSLVGRGGTVPTRLFTTESRAWLTEYGWWVALVTFAWSAEWQLDHIWEDLNIAAQESREE